jgi:hypothetical protein
LKLAVVRGGGVAGIAIKTELVSDDLAPEDAKTLHEMVRDAGILDLQEAGPQPSHPDEISYQLTVEHEGRKRTVNLTESTMPAAVRSLIAWSDSVPGSRKRIDPGGRAGG